MNNVKNLLPKHRDCQTSRHWHLAALVKRIETGDERALAELRSLTTPKLQPLVRRNIPNLLDVEALLNHVFLQVWQQSRGYDSQRGSVMSWLNAIAVGRSIDFCRKAQVVERRAQAMGPDQGFDLQAETNLERLLLDSERRQVIRSAVARLPGLRRKMIVLAFFRDLSHAEISNQTHIALGSVKSHIRRGLFQLRADIAAAQFQRSCNAIVQSNRLVVTCKRLGSHESIIRTFFVRDGRSGHIEIDTCATDGAILYRCRLSNRRVGLLSSRHAVTIRLINAT